MPAPRELFHNGHYNILAKRIREVRAAFGEELTHEEKTGADYAMNDLVARLAKKFEEDNPRFEIDLWLSATETEF